MKNRTRNSKTTIAGRNRIKLYSLEQLEKQFDISSRPRDKDKILSRMKVLKAHGIIGETK